MHAHRPLTEGKHRAMIPRLAMPPAVVTDSVACLPRELAERYAIRIVPVNVLFEGQVYRDWVDLTPSLAYEMLRKNPSGFSTSSPSPQEFLDVFREVGQRSREILCITMSSRLSTLYNAAIVASRMLEKELPGTKIEVVDSQTVAGGNGLIAWLMALKGEGGASLREMARMAEEMKGRVYVFVALETLRHVHRTGRIPKVASTLGSLLPVKPMLSVRGGLVHFLSVARTREKALRHLLELMEERVGQEPVWAIISHAACPEEAEKFRGMVASRFPRVEAHISEFSPIMGYATGPGTLALAFYSEKA
jgi:DegV family protein with EDD domain